MEVSITSLGIFFRTSACVSMGSFVSLCAFTKIAIYLTFIKCSRSGSLSSNEVEFWLLTVQPSYALYFICYWSQNKPLWASAVVQFWLWFAECANFVFKWNLEYWHFILGGIENMPTSFSDSFLAHKNRVTDWAKTKLNFNKRPKSYSLFAFFWPSCGLPWKGTGLFFTSNWTRHHMMLGKN